MNSIYLTIIVNLIFFFFFEKINKIINIYDNPNLKRKIHKHLVSVAGGVLFYTCILIYFIFCIFEIDSNSFSHKENILLILVTSLFFWMGIFDDKFSLQANIRLFLGVFFLLIILLLDKDFVISELRFSFANSIIPLESFSIIFTAVCILLFANACNMFDGIDLQFGLYTLFLIFILFSKNILSNLFIVLLICSINFLFFNFKKKLFIGNNGALFLGVFFSLIFIYAYNKKYIFYSDEIFLYMSFPGFDMIRVCIARLMKGKNIFEADTNHLHHLLLKKFNSYQVVTISFCALIIPVVYYILFQNILISCVLSLVIYSFLILVSKVKKKL